MCADADMMAGLAFEQILRPWATLNYGDPRLAPRFRYVTELPDEVDAKATSIDRAACSAGPAALEEALKRSPRAQEAIGQFLAGKSGQ